MSFHLDGHSVLHHTTAEPTRTLGPGRKNPSLPANPSGSSGWEPRSVPTRIASTMTLGAKSGCLVSGTLWATSAVPKATSPQARFLSRGEKNRGPTRRQYHGALRSPIRQPRPSVLLGNMHDNPSPALAMVAVLTTAAAVYMVTAHLTTKKKKNGGLNGEVLHGVRTEGVMFFYCCTGGQGYVAVDGAESASADLRCWLLIWACPEQCSDAPLTFRAFCLQSRYGIPKFSLPLLSISQHQQPAPQHPSRLVAIGDWSGTPPTGEKRRLTKLVRPNIQDLTPYRCARDDYSEGVLLDANENSFGPALGAGQVSESSHVKHGIFCGLLSSHLLVLQ